MNFDERVYNLIKRIPAGRVSTYGSVARKLGNIHLSRRVGLALNRNLYPYTLKKNKKILIPCHRIINSSGFLGGFNRGLPQKIKLLRKEGIKIINNKIDLNEYSFKL